MNMTIQITQFVIGFEKRRQVFIRSLNTSPES